MYKFFIFLAFLAVPSLAKFVWKTDETMMKKVGEALRGTEYDAAGGTTVLDLGTLEPTTNNKKVIALCQATFEGNINASFYYLPVVIDAEGQIHFASGSIHYLDLELAKIDAEHYFYCPFAFKYIWQRTSYYYKLLENSPPHAPKPVVLDSAYGISDPTVIMACTTGDDGRVGLIHYKHKDNFSFTVRLRTNDGSYEVIHTSKEHNLLYNMQQELSAYLQVPVQWAEHWREGIKELRQVFLDGVIVKLVSQLMSKSSIDWITIEKAKRVRTDLSKIAVFCREQSTMIPILAIVTSPAEGDDTFEINYIYIHNKSKDDGFIENKLQEYLTKEAFPLTNAWVKVTDTSDWLTEIENMVKNELVSRKMSIEACKVVETRNVGSTYTQKAAILRLETVEAKSYGDGSHVYVAWTESNGNSIKAVGKIARKIDQAEDDFNFYGFSSLAYTELKFENSVGWYSKEKVPKFLRDAMPKIMEDVFALRPNIEGGYVDPSYALYWLQEAGRISTTKLREGEIFFRLMVKRNSNVEVETIEVDFIFEEYIKIL